MGALPRDDRRRGASGASGRSDQPHRVCARARCSGCDVQTYRLGESSFFGPGSSFTLDSSRPFTLVTQFVTADGTDDGELSEIRRHYVQDGKRIDSPTVSLGGTSYSSISDGYCTAELDTFGGNTT
eukprot:2517939-Prymnesium_polylepis.2